MRKRPSFLCLVHVGSGFFSFLCFGWVFFFVCRLRIVALHEAWPFKQKAYDDAAAAGDPTDQLEMVILWFWQVLLVGYKKDTFKRTKMKC